MAFMLDLVGAIFHNLAFCFDALLKQKIQKVHKPPDTKDKYPIPKYRKVLTRGNLQILAVGVPACAALASRYVESASPLSPEKSSFIRH